MKIIKLEAENIKKIKAVEIKPDSNLVQITGANAQGKTSVLDSIWYALGGKEAIDSKPIREGEDQATVTLELDDLVIKRVFKRRNDAIITTLFVENKDGAHYSSPQTMLDNLVGKLSFDPLAFSNMKSREQFTLLCDLCEIEYSFDEAAEIKKEIYDERTFINRQRKEFEAEEKNIVIDDEVQTEKVDAQSLIKQIQEAQEWNAKQETTKHSVKSLAEYIESRYKDIHDIKQEIDDKNNLLHDLERSVEAPKEIALLQADLNSAEQINRNAEKFERKNKLSADAAFQQSRADDCTRKLQKIDDDKIAALKASKMPISGLSIDDDQVFYNTIPFEQLSGAEKLKISLAIAVATNPKLKVIRIADGSLLDNNSMSELLKLANEKDYQIWIERVDESGNVGICIEDGMIKNNKSNISQTTLDI